MKPFDLSKALTGKPVCDREGNEVKNFRVRVFNDKYCVGSFEDYPYVAEDVVGTSFAYTSDGVYDIGYQSNRDLFMADEQTEDNREIALLRERLQKVEDLLGLKDDEEIDPYQELKDAVAQGKELQFKSPLDEKWKSLKDFDLFKYEFSSTVDRYRIKPETVKYRVYEWKSGNLNGIGFVQNVDQEYGAIKRQEFVKWISEWIEIEL